jgi:RHS repeat-associated protein
MPFSTGGKHTIKFKAASSSLLISLTPQGGGGGSKTCYIGYITIKESFKDEYRYGFNGKEKDNETFGDGNASDFGARIYDSRLMRWLCVDPHADRYPSLSGCSAFGNNPISVIDPDGRDIIYYNQKGKETNRTVQDGAHVYYMNHKDGNVSVGGQNYYQGNSYASFFGDRTNPEYSIK